MFPAQLPSSIGHDRAATLQIEGWAGLQGSRPRLAAWMVHGKRLVRCGGPMAASFPPALLRSSRSTRWARRRSTGKCTCNSPLCLLVLQLRWRC